MRTQMLAVAIATGLSIVGFGVHAQSLADVFTQGQVDSELRLYDFNRIYASPAKPNARALSGALLLNAKTATFGGGFSLGTSLLTANAFGTRSGATAKIDTTLMGPGNSVSALGQAYLQYQRDPATFRIGDQYLNTPWMGRSDSRVLPASYQAALAELTPTQGWHLFGIRTYGWKSRSSSDYHFDNLYYPSTWRGDSMYGGSGGLPATARSARGTRVLGTTYAVGGFKAQAWYYDFLGFARMGYIDASYTFQTGSGFDPFVAAQYLGEAGSAGGNVLVAKGVKLFGVTGSAIRSQAWGVHAGFKIPHGQFDVSYNEIARKHGAVGEGAIVSPYTAGYATDPLYTTSMIRGLVEQGPGQAWKARVQYGFLDGRLLLQVAYAQYTTTLRGDSHDVYFDVTWKLDRWLKGLSVRDRWERSTGGVGLNPGNAAFTYNRLMLDYKF